MARHPAFQKGGSHPQYSGSNYKTLAIIGDPKLRDIYIAFFQFVYGSFKTF